MNEKLLLQTSKNILILYEKITTFIYVICVVPKRGKRGGILMEDWLMTVFMKCLEKGVVISMVALLLTMVTVAVVPKNWYGQTCTQSRFEVLVFCVYYLVLLFIIIIFPLCIKLIYPFVIESIFF